MTFSNKWKVSFNKSLYRGFLKIGNLGQKGCKDFIKNRHLFSVKLIILFSYSDWSLSANILLDSEATVGMFDWRLFDNSNRTKVVRRPKKLGCSTQIMFDGKLTIVEHKINRTKSEKWLCSINSYFDFENEQLSNKKLIELNQESDYVRLILCSINCMFY